MRNKNRIESMKAEAHWFCAVGTIGKHLHPEHSIQAIGLDATDTSCKSNTI